MKCPKCGYQSFNHLITCKKCGRDLAGLQAKLGFGQIVVPALRNPAGTTRTTGAAASEYSGEELLEDYFRSIPEPDSEEAAVAAPLARPVPPVAEPPSNNQNHQESPETDTFPDGEEAEDTFPFPFDKMDADLDALQKEDEGSGEPFVLGNPFDELDLGLPPRGNNPGSPSRHPTVAMRGPKGAECRIRRSPFPRISLFPLRRMRRSRNRMRIFSFLSKS